MSGDMTQSQPATRNARLVVKPQIVEPKAKFQTQTMIANYTRASIVHLEIQLYVVNEQTGEASPALSQGGMPIVADLLNSQLDNPVEFGSLAPNTTYRVVCRAYKAAGNAPSDLISTTDATSFTDVAIGEDDQSFVTLRVRLIDIDFNATATSPGIVITDGGYTNGGDPTITVGTPAPMPTPESTPEPTPTPGG
ncbi:MAG: hypothetical protein FJZ01_07505 [Candidatus Sericytochromatia bacterium]|nr:hypothetical protein [Candidatus Tanganyikabacteria bacterium]